MSSVTCDPWNGGIHFIKKKFLDMFKLANQLLLLLLYLISFKKKSF